MANKQKLADCCFRYFCKIDRETEKARQTGRQEDRQTDRQTGRQTDRQIDRQAVRQADTQIQADKGKHKQAREVGGTTSRHHRQG